MSTTPPPSFDSRMSSPPEARGTAIPVPQDRGRGRGQNTKSTKRPTKRIVSFNRVFALAAAACVIVVIAGYYYTSSKGTYEAVYAINVAAGSPITAAGTSSSADITAIKVSTAEITIGAFTSSTQAGAISKALAAIPSGSLSIGVLPIDSPVLASDFSTSLVPLAQLGKDQIVSLSAAVNNAVSGSLTVGDYVDIYLTPNTTSSKTVLTPAVLVASDIKIVAIRAGEAAYQNISSEQSSDRTLVPSNVLPTDPVPGNYIIQATPAQAALVAAAQSSGATIYLSYVAPPSTAPTA